MNKPKENYEHTADNLRRLLIKAMDNEISHLELADWCYTWCQKNWNDDETVKESQGLQIAEEIDTQWELYLANTYNLEELKNMNKAKVKLPDEWLLSWLKKLK